MILGLVCARYRSEGLPGKNIRPMHGKPLIEYAIEKALASICDEVMVCTDIPRHEWSMAVQRIERPEHLCGPEVAKWDVWRHAQAETGAEVVVDIDVTRPMTTAEDVDGCVAMLGASGMDGVAAASPSKKHPQFDVLRYKDGGLRTWEASIATARQQLSPAYEHGGVYAFSAEALATFDHVWDAWVAAYLIPRERALDIDDELDWKIVEAFMAQRMQPA
jgi:CMP-N-acetylneuraminic acid synthetase